MDTQLPGREEDIRGTQSVVTLEWYVERSISPDCVMETACARQKSRGVHSRRRIMLEIGSICIETCGPLLQAPERWP